MSIGGSSLILILGLINFLLLSFQLASGLRWLKVPMGVHRRTGILLAVCATLHGVLALLAEML